MTMETFVVVKREKRRGKKKVKGGDGNKVPGEGIDVKVR